MGQIPINNILSDALSDQQAGKGLDEALLDACKKHHPEHAKEVLEAIKGRIEVEIYTSRCSRGRAIESCIEHDAVAEVASIQTPVTEEETQGIPVPADLSPESAPQVLQAPNTQPTPSWAQEPTPPAPVEQQSAPVQPVAENRKETGKGEEKKGFLSRFLGK